MSVKTKATRTAWQVEREFQETSVAWYAHAKVIEIWTTDSTTIAMMAKRGWEPEKGRKAKDGEPYLCYRIPRRALTIRSRKSVETKRKGRSKAAMAKARAARRK